MPVTTVSSSSEFDGFIGKKNVTLVDFYADWFASCRLTQFPNVNFIKVNVDDCPDIASRYSVTAMPTLIFFMNGAEKAKVVGANMGEITRHLNSLSSGASSGPAFSGQGYTLSGQKRAASSGSSQDNSSLYMFGVIGLVLLYLYMNQ
ncbi:Cytoplasmic thioredoxin isoenzyme 2 [Kappamyces sp. JEL0680]|nr:Cytoplasmic thioredoxin isoenzyme 2 [Kappamyces sp. JEL0680]